MTLGRVSSLIVVFLLVMKPFVRSASNFPVLNMKPVDRGNIDTNMQLEGPWPGEKNVREKLPRHLHQARGIPSGFPMEAQPILNGRLSVNGYVSQPPRYRTYQNSYRPLHLLPVYGSPSQRAHGLQYRILWPPNNHSMKASKEFSFEKSTLGRDSNSTKLMQSVNECKNDAETIIEMNCTYPIATTATRRVTSASINVKEKESSDTSRNDSFHKFRESLDVFERKFYEVTFMKLSSNSPVERRENGISFVQSGLFLHLLLMTLSSEVDAATRAQIEQCLGIAASDTQTSEIVKHVVSTLPVSSDALKFRWSSRVVVGAPAGGGGGRGGGGGGGAGLRTGAPSALNLQVDHLNGTETPETLAKLLNHMVEIDSGGAMRDTFEEDEMSSGARGVLLSTVYLRGQWRAAPTLLNESRPFREDGGAPGAPPPPRRSTRMIRINDVMRYADFSEWDAEALEIFYATPGLSLLLLVPRGGSLRALAARAAGTSVRAIAARMYTVRVAATVPLYTLRMTLLLPSKLQAMGISRLVEPSDGPADGGDGGNGGGGGDGGGLRLSHAVQRLMFWSEAGRNAFKDDGIEWDEPPELELVVDRPYVFFVRWRNITLMNGNFVL